MSPHDLVTLEDDDAMPTSSSPMSRTGGSPRNGRVLYCRKCEGHGEKVVLKNHAPGCPYILCTCRSCERLNQKRLKSFNKRNKEKLELAAILTEQRRKEREQDYDYQAPSRKLSSCSTSSSTMDSEQGSTRTGLEGRSMSLGAMTVMSYDIWKAKCAAEKKRLEQEGKAPPSPIEEVKMRKRAHTFMAPEESKELPKVQPPHLNEKKKGRYIVLPTIPAMKIFVDEDMEKKMEENMDDTPAPVTVSQPMESRVQDLKINSPRAIKPIQAMPPPHHPTPVSVSLQQSFMKPTVPMTVPSLPVPSLASSLSMGGGLSRFNPAPTTTTSAAAPGFSAEQIVLLQNNILQQQNQALQQLLSQILPISNPSPPTTTPSPDLVTLLKYQQIAPHKPILEPTPQDLLQTLLRPQPQAIFSHGM